MKEHSNRIWWKTKRDWYSTYRVVSETTVDGYNSALIEKTALSDGFTRFNLLVDLSKYRKCWTRIFYEHDDYKRNQILGFDVYLNALQKNVKFIMLNLSPSPWDSGFGIAYYIESKIYEKPKNKIDSMKDALRIGINENNIGHHIEPITKEVIYAMQPMIKCFENCGEPILTPENEFYL